MHVVRLYLLVVLMFTMHVILAQRDAIWHSVEKLLSNATPNTENIFLLFYLLLLIFGVLSVCIVFNGSELKMLLCTSHRDMLPLMLWQFVAIVK